MKKKKTLSPKLKKLTHALMLAACSPLTYGYNFVEKADLSGQLTFDGSYIDNKQVEARIFGVTGYVNIHAPWTETLLFDVSAGATLETGSNNSFILDEYAPARQWRLKRAYLKWNPLSFFDFKVGAVDQKDYASPLLLTNAAFLAAVETFSFSFSDNHKLFFKMEQAIPNNLFLAQRIGVVQDGTPKFLMETIGLDLKGDILSLMVQGSRFSYESLSTGAAYQSQFVGNSVSGGSQLNSDYLYRFSGFNLASRLEGYLFDGFGLSVSGQYLYNEKAPEGRNTGYFLKANFIFDHIRPGAMYFSNESDSSPAFYNSSFFSHNNHEGFALELAYRDPNKDASDVEASLTYVDSSPIKFNTFQSGTVKILFDLSFNFDL